MYYNWDLKTGPRSSVTFRQLSPPFPEQLTTSAYLQEWYPINRELAAFEGNLDDLNEIIDRIRTLEEAQQEKFDNLPDSLQEAETGQLLEERMEECGELVEECKSIAQEWDDGDQDVADIPFLDMIHGKVQEASK